MKIVLSTSDIINIIKDHFIFKQVTVKTVEFKESSNGFDNGFEVLIDAMV